MKCKGIKIEDFLYLLLDENYKIQKKLEINNEEIFGMTNLQIQKLMYFIEGLFMAKFNKKIIKKKYKAWTYGPVLEELYFLLRKNGKSYIEKDNLENFNEIKIHEIEKKFTNEELEFIERVFIYFSKYSAFELVSLSHIEGPWKETKNNEEINNDKMLYYFQEKLNQIEQLI
ncbi:DUF4065 domain-containing protein [Spiroplasma citri]|uniref:Panacea domain-containing protein n=1 Tax=Spiroplasma citri TaxID=2133 RepID=UPI0024124C4A|nr:type II toxin-antitoxin system antitoxin SocA domain-containing protein [Spiroplasma citri]WFG98103.1 DUF4065 domain-containing protein [Spiroplasma citri]